MKFQVDGKLHKVFDTEQKSEKFRAREFVIEVSDGKFPQMVKFQLTQDKCEAIDNHREGEQITVHFDLRGREWNGKYFTNLNAWRIESGAAASGPDGAPPHTEADIASMSSGNFDDDMPF
ncbi:MAG: DUF3127 domain-containing protein [Granulosicoccaceae bacterium]